MKPDYLSINSKNLRDYEAYWVEPASEDKHSWKSPLTFYQVILCIRLFLPNMVTLR